MGIESKKWKRTLVPHKPLFRRAQFTVHWFCWWVHAKVKTFSSTVGRGRPVQRRAQSWVERKTSRERERETQTGHGLQWSQALPTVAGSRFTACHPLTQWVNLLFQRCQAAVQTDCVSCFQLLSFPFLPLCPFLLLFPFPGRILFNYLW